MAEITRVNYVDGKVVFEIIAPEDFYASPEEIAAADTFNARQALDELLRRHPDWDTDPPCPDCGSREHLQGGR